LILGAIDAMFASDDPRSPQRELQICAPIELPARPRIDARRLVSAQQDHAGRRGKQMALLGADGLRAIDQSARPDALTAGRLAVEQPKALRSPVALRAHELRPEAAVYELPHSHADPIFDAFVAEPDKRRDSAARDVALRHQGRGANHWQIVDCAFHEPKNYRLWTLVSILLCIAPDAPTRDFSCDAVSPKPTWSCFMASTLF
jgi:hypothetical protein